MALDMCSWAGSAVRLAHYLGIWKGSGFAEIDPVTIDDALLRRGVDHMLAGFGPQPTDSVARAP